MLGGTKKTEKESHSGLKGEVFGQPVYFPFRHFLRVLI